MVFDDPELGQEAELSVHQSPVVFAGYRDSVGALEEEESVLRAVQWVVGKVDFDHPPYVCNCNEGVRTTEANRNCTQVFLNCRVHHKS